MQSVRRIDEQGLNLPGQILDSRQALARATSPLADYRERRAVWLEPRIVAEVSFGGSVERGLRDPVLRRLLRAGPD